MLIKRVCVIGGTGFVGNRLLNLLSANGYHCRVLARHPERNRHLQVNPGIKLVRTPRFDSEALKAHFKDCDAVINLAGILHPGSGNQSFEQVHVQLVTSIVEACRASGTKRLLQMSALNASEEIVDSHYLHTKGIGETIAHGDPRNLCTTSFRPSVIFGRDDSFINRFVKLLRIPGPMPLACPGSILSPVYIDDVANAFILSLERPEDCHQRLDLCGPDQFTLIELIRKIADATGKHKTLLPLSDRLSKLQAKILQRVPGKPFTLDNYYALQYPGRCGNGGLPALGIQPTSLSSFLARQFNST